MWDKRQRKSMEKWRDGREGLKIGREKSGKRKKNGRLR